MKKHKVIAKVPETVDSFYEYESAIRKYCTDMFGPVKRKGRKRNRNNWTINSTWVKYHITGSFKRNEDAVMFAMRWS
jgi:hypothetical protein